MEELSILRCKRLGKHLLAEETTDFVEGLEVQRAINSVVSELGVDLLHVASQIAGECICARAHVLDSGLDQELIANISIDQLEDGLLEGDLCLEVRTLEGSTGLLYANTRASTTESGELEAVLGRTNAIRSRTNTTKRNVVCEGRSGQRGRGDGHFLNNGTHNVRDIGERTTIDGVDIGTLASKNLCDLSDDTVGIFGREVLDCCQIDAIRSHGILFFVSLQSHHQFWE